MGGDGGPVASRRDERRDPRPAGAPRCAALDCRSRRAARRRAARAGARAGAAGAEGAAGTPARSLILSLLAALAFSGTAAAHGDPASLYLHTRQVFIPTDVAFPTAKKQRLAALVAAANDAGFAIRVALIANSYELGAVPQLWRRPRVYAEFAGEELKDEAKYRGRVLVAMPNGLGFHRNGHSGRREYALLEQIPVRPGTSGLIDAAIAGVRRLAADSHVQLRVEQKRSDRNNRDRVDIILAAVAALAVVALVREVLRRRGHQRT
jgi:hypothetical protein